MRKYVKKFKKKYYTSRAKQTVATFQEPLHVNGKTSLTSQTFLGKNCNFNGMVVSGNGKVEIGDNFHSGPECLMITQFHNYDKGDSIPYDSSYIEKPIKIEDNIWLGSRVIILGGVTIGEGAIIQAGAVVVSDIPKYSIAGGNPAKAFKYRDIEHYKECKKNGKFH